MREKHPELLEEIRDQCISRGIPLDIPVEVLM
jgi:hypothetical protein